ERLLPNARRKLKSKGLDAIVATQLYPKGKRRGPFGTDPVDGAILKRGGSAKSFKGLSKSLLAARILETVEALLLGRGRKR
ncbi:MAG: hypothetical protein HYZ90_04985, partial [Candidatus Omnitrophica bacterium]|nr:hypothetical protein [Candidatus Omnitrophota bacterium]